MPSETANMAGGPGPAAAQSNGTLPRFDLEDLRNHGWRDKFLAWALHNPEWWLLAPLRRFFPIARIPFAKVVGVARYDDVQEVLKRDDVFRVPFAQHVMDLSDGHNFLLGMEANQEHCRMQRGIMEVFRHEDIAAIVTPLSAKLSEEILDSSDGELDAIEGLISLVPTRIIEEYFGVRVTDTNSDQDRRDFAHWMIAMNTFTFGNPDNNPRYRAAALAAKVRVSALIERRIEEEAKKADPNPHTVLGRLIALQRADPTKIDAATICLWLIGMITGFVPTCTLGAGKALDELLSRPEFLKRCQAAASAGDDDLLQRCIHETMRFKPIFLGPQRACTRDYILAEGTPRATLIREGEAVLPSTWSAMFDARRIVDPYAFNPDRPASNYMLFGLGAHSCLGLHIAEAQVLQTMKALLRRKGLQRAPGKKGKLDWLGQIPGRLFVTFKVERGPVH